MANTASTPRGALVIARILWAALLMGQVMFLVVIIAIRQTRGADSPPQGLPLAYIAIAMALGAVPVAYVLRKVVQGPVDEQGHTPPAKYFTGNLLFLALLEGVSLFGLVVFLLGDPMGLIASALLMLVQIVNFPTGSSLGQSNP